MAQFSVTGDTNKLVANTALPLESVVMPGGERAVSDAYKPKPGGSQQHQQPRQAKGARNTTVGGGLPSMKKQARSLERLLRRNASSSGGTLPADGSGLTELMGLVVPSNRLSGTLPSLAAMLFKNGLAATRSTPCMMIRGNQEGKQALNVQ